MTLTVWQNHIMEGDRILATFSKPRVALMAQGCLDGMRGAAMPSEATALDRQTLDRVCELLAIRRARTETPNV